MLWLEKINIEFKVINVQTHLLDKRYKISEGCGTKFKQSGCLMRMFRVKTEYRPFVR